MSDEIPRPHFDISMSQSATESLARFYTGVESDIHELAAVAQEMPAFRSLIIRAANASTHGLQHAIRSPQHAMAMLGASRMKQLVDELMEQNEKLRSTTLGVLRNRPRDD